MTSSWTTTPTANTTATMSKQTTPATPAVTTTATVGEQAMPIVTTI